MKNNYYLILTAKSQSNLNTPISLFLKSSTSSYKLVLNFAFILFAALSSFGQTTINVSGGQPAVCAFANGDYTETGIGTSVWVKNSDPNKEIKRIGSTWVIDDLGPICCGANEYASSSGGSATNPPASGWSGLCNGHYTLTGSGVFVPARVFVYSDNTLSTLLSSHYNIQDAVNAAVAGNSIRVDAGTYNENVTVNKAVYINGPQKDVDPRTAAALRTAGSASEAIVDGGGGSSPVFNITSSGVVLNGLEVRNGSGDLIVSPDDEPAPAKTGVIVKYCLVNTSGDEGIQLRNLDGGGVEYCLVSSTTGDGINLSSGCTNSYVKNNEITGSASTNGFIYLYDNGPSMLVDNNLLTGNTGENGIMIGNKSGSNFNKNSAFTNNAIVSNNTVIGHTGSEVGIYINTSRVNVADNTITEWESSGNAALYLRYNIKDIVVTDNTITGNVNGIKVSSGVSATNALLITINQNDISANTDGMSNSSSGVVNATLNWWGNADGPSGSGPGTGTSVSANVDFCPWLDAAPPAGLPTSTSGAVVNTTTLLAYCSIQAAIDDPQTLNGHTLVASAGTYGEIITVNKDLTIQGPNVGTAGNDVRVAEAIISDGKINILGANTVVIDGFKIYQTNTTTPVSLGGSAVATIQNCILERVSATTGDPTRGIEISAGPGVKTIANNLFTGDVSGGLYSGHKTWNSGMYINGAASTVAINNNVFENCRTALNIDDMSVGITLAGNSLSNSGTLISFGGTTAATGSFTFGANDYDVIGTFINLSNAAANFRLDITAGTYSGTAFSALPLTTLFEIDLRIYHKGRYTATSNGLVTYVANNIYAPNYTGLPAPVIDDINVDISYATSGNIINLQDGTFNQRVVVNKSLTLKGQSEAGTILDGTALGNGRGIAINNGITNVTIQDLTVQNFIGSSGNADAGIYAIGGNSNLNVNHVTIQNNVGGSGFYANGPVNGVTLDYVTSSGHTTGARGIVIWNGLKENITITNCTVFNNNCCGIELQDGTASGVTMTGNNVYNNGDNGFGLTGMQGPGENLISGNTVTNNGRFGIEVKNPNGSGLATGAGRIVVENNNVSRTVPITDLRDIVGIAVFRRGVLAGNVDVPNGVIVQTNTVSGYVQASTSDGFGIVIEGTNSSALNNTINGNDVGLQLQSGHLPYPADGDQNNVADDYFGRGNSPITCGITVSGNTFSGNGVDERNVPSSVANGIVTNTTSSTTYCSIQAAIDAASPGDEIVVGDGTYNENITIGVNGLTITSVNGAASTIIQGSNSSPKLGTVVFAPGTSGITFGETGNGFTVNGIDGTPGLEKGAIYFQGAQTNQTIEGNIVNADGDAAIQTEYGAAINGLTINDNTIGGQTFTGANPGGEGFSAQFTLPNVPRSAVYVGGASNGANKQNIVFTNNNITAVTGGMSITDNSGGAIAPTPQGNTIISIDAATATITGNTFNGVTARFATDLRARGPAAGNTITGNSFDNSSNPSYFVGDAGLLTGLANNNTFAAGPAYANRATGQGAISPTIMGAIAGALPTEEVIVLADTYNENIIIDKALTLTGPNAGLDCSTRAGAEAIIAPTTGVPVSITADGVTLNGFEITAPDAYNAIALSNTSNTTVSYNKIHDIGTNLTGGGNIHAIVNQLSASNSSNVSISNNCIEDIGSVGFSNFSLSAIGVLQSTSTGVLTGLTIEDNVIDNLNVNTATWPNGKIVYGIQINVGGGSGYLTTTGKVVNASISGNSISNLTGFIPTAIGLEGNTENAVVEGNTISNLTGYKLAARSGGGYDLNGLKFENNRFVSSVTVQYNSFQTNTFTYGPTATTGLGYAVANYVAEADGGIATLNCNWFGSANYGDLVDNATLTGKIFNKENCQTVFIPYLTTSNIGVGNTCDGIAASPSNLAVTYNAASENVVVTFNLDDNTPVISPIPGLNPALPADLAQIEAKYLALQIAIATSTGVEAAALDLGDDIITEYYYLDAGNPVYLQTAGGNPLVKSKYWDQYLNNTSTAVKYPNFGTSLFEVPIGAYSTSTNPITGAVNSGWLSAVYGKDLYVKVTVVHNGTVASQTQSVAIGPAPIVNVNTGLGYLSLQAAIDDPLTLNSHTITVSSGTYNENVVVNKSLTINGPNAGVACGSRVAEAIISPAAGVPVTITADGVTLNGFEITAPDAFYGVNLGGTSNTTVSFNNIHDIGTNKTGGGNVHALLYTVGSSNTSTVSITDNCLNNISSSSLSGFSASAIGVLQSTSTGVLDGLSILRNAISNVNVNTAVWPTGKIAYGIQINVAGGGGYASSTGNAKNANISYNTITNVEGYIATGIALEGNTEDAVIERNEVTNLTAYKLANRAGGGYDLNGLKFENNRYVSTVTVQNNSFDASTFTHDATLGRGYAIANYVPETIGGAASLSCNWFGSANYADLVVDYNAAPAPTGKIFNKDGAGTAYIQYLTNNTIDPIAGGYSCSGAHATAASLNVAYTAASENIVVTFDVTGNAVAAYPIPGLNPTVPADLAAITAKYVALQTAVATGTAAEQKAAALDLGDDIITEYFYMDGANEVYLQTVSSSDIIKTKYWDQYLNNTSTATAYPNFGTSLFVVPTGSYSTSTNPLTGLVPSGWLAPVFGKDLHVRVTVVHNGNVDIQTATVPIGPGPVKVYTDNTLTTLVSSHLTIQEAINATATLSGYFITVDAGTYVEDVNVTKSLTISGADPVTTIVSGPMGGNGATFRVSTSGIVIEGFTITREGNNTTDWNDGTLNSAGVAIQGQTNNAIIRNNIITGNRTGIDINNSNGNQILDNNIDFNRTGLLFRNQTDNTIMTGNFITDNWTMGVLFIDASSGTNSPLQTALNSQFNNNNISGNWYGDIVDRQVGGSLPVPGTTNLKDFECNWYGTTSPVVSTANSAEPGYAAQIPVAYGGTATNPGGAPNILGPASANFEFIPHLVDGTDDNLGSAGFQPVAGSCISDQVQNVTQSTYHLTIQAAVNAANPNDEILAPAATYNETVTVNKALTINGANAGVSACTTRVAESIIQNGAFIITASNVTIDGFELTGTGAQIRAGASVLSDISILNNNIHATTAQIAIQHGLGNGGGIGSSNWTISGNKIDDIQFANSTAIVAFNITNATIENNCITHTNASFTGRRGINADGLQTASIKGNTIDLGDAYPSGLTNTPWAIQIGLSDRDATGITVTENTILNTYFAVFTLSQRNVTGLSITCNDISGVALGVALNSGSATPAITQPLQSDVTIENNAISSSNRSVYVRNLHSAHANGPVEFNNVKVINNSLARTTAGAVLEAEVGLTINDGQVLGDKNWFGSASYAVISPLVVGSVTFIPFMVDGTDQNLTSICYVPDPLAATGGNVHNVTQNTYHATIQLAIDALTTTNGDLIEVPSGTYNEHVLVNKRLHIVGAGPALTIVQGFTNGADVIRITEGGSDAVNRTIIKDLKVATTSTGNGNNGIKIDASGNNPLGYITIDNVHGMNLPGNSAGILLHGTAVTTDIITDVKLDNVNFAFNNFGLYSKNAQVHGLAIDGSVARSKFEDNRHSGILIEGNGALATQYQAFTIEKTDLSRNNSIGDVDPGRAEMFLLGFNGNLTVKDVVVTSGLATPNATPWYVAMAVNGKYTGGAAPSGIMLFEDVIFNSAAGASHFPRASLGIWTFTNLDAGVTVNGCEFNSQANGTHANNRGGLYLFSVGGATPLELENSTFSGNYAYNGVANDICMISSSVNVTATTGNVFTGAASNFAIEDRVYHALDNIANGMVTWVASSDYVTTNTLGIQRGIDALTAPGDVHIESGVYTGNVDASLKDVTLIPGSSPGCVTIGGNLTLGSLNTLDMEADGTTACTGYDQFTVNGVVTLGGATLNLILGYAPVNGDELTLILNDGVDAVIGQFAQGNYINVAGDLFQINYTGGDGNDVVLTRCSGGVVNTNTLKVFCSIQDAIDDPTTLDNHLITVAAGTYAEIITVNKKLIIQGPNAGIDPNTTPRVAEAIIVFPTGLSGYQDLMKITTTGVAIDGFKLDGQGYVPADGTSGIIGYANNINIKNNIISNFNYVSVWMSSYHPNYPTPSGNGFYRTALRVTNNYINNAEIFNLANGSVIGYGVYMQGAYGLVSRNVIEDTRDAIQVQPYNHPNAGAVLGSVRNNTLEGYREPLYFNYSENANARWSFALNNIIGIAAPNGSPEVEWRGIRIQTITTVPTVLVFEDNTISTGTANPTGGMFLLRKWNNVVAGAVDMDAIYADNTWVDPNAVITNSTNILNPAATDVYIYTKIQNAIDDASANDFVEASEGAFNENVTVNKALTLLGVNAGTAGCDGGRVTESEINGAGTAVNITSDDVTIDGFKITGITAISSVGRTNVTVENNLIEAHETGIYSENSTAPYVVQNNCITMSDQTYATQGFASNPTLSVTSAPATWYVDRYAPNSFTSAAFDGDTRLKHSIVAADQQPSAFQNTQGRKYDTDNATSASIELYVPASWETSGERMAGFWGTGFDAGNSVSLYPIIEFSSDGAPANPRFRVYNNGVWVDMGLPSGFTYNSWVDLSMTIVNDEVVFAIGDLSISIPALGTTHLGNVILQGHNFKAGGMTYDIYWDNLKVYGGVPAETNRQTTGIALLGASGATAITVIDNSVDDAFYGYLLNNINTSTQTTVEGGSIAGVMQGVSLVNTLDGATHQASNIRIKGVTMSGFAGDYSANAAFGAYNFHAGVYSFSTDLGSSLAATTLDIEDCDIQGTLTPSQASAGVEIADFSSAGTTLQSVTITNSAISGNANRGVDARGYVVVTLTGNTLANNGSNAWGLSGNDGYTILARNGAAIDASLNFITHPAASTTDVIALQTGNAPNSSINAYNNSILMNGNPDGFGAIAGSGDIMATCNWWGSASGPAAALFSGTTVTYSPWMINSDLNNPDCPNIYVFPRVFLEGPYDVATHAMTTHLTSGGASCILATDGGLAQPYNVAPWSYAGTESVSASFFATHTDIVDWVLVELRDKTTNTIIVARRAGFVKSDGTVVDIDGTTGLAFEGLSADDYYISVRHRNHLGVMGNATVTLDATPLGNEIDFTTTATVLYGSNAAEEVEPGVVALHMGNANYTDNIIKFTGASNDKAAIGIKVNSSVSLINTYAGYSFEDIDLDGVAAFTGSGNDKAKLGIKLNTAVNLLNTFVEQLP